MTGVEATDLVWQLAREIDELSYHRKETFRFHFRMVSRSKTAEDARYWLPGAWAPVEVPAGLLEKGIKALKASGWRVTRRYMPHGKLGQARSQWESNTLKITKQSVCLNTCADPSVMFLVLLHEWAHTLLHHDPRKPQGNRATKEIEAETTCYLVAQRIGIVSRTSALYLACSVGVDGDDLREMPAGPYTRIGFAANRILSALGY